MEKNMGIADRLIRPSLAIAFVGLYMADKVTGTTGKLLLALSGMFLITSAFGSCPVYQALGVDTITEGERVSIP
jgi:hypothetical protein